MRFWDRGLCDHVPAFAQADEDDRAAAIADAVRAKFVTLVVLGLASLMLGGLGGLYAGSALTSWLWPKDADAAKHDGMVALVQLGSLLVSLLGVGWCWVLLRKTILRRELSLHSRRGKCPSCGYSLVGVPSVDGYLTCPECATSANTMEVGRDEDRCERDGRVMRVPKAWGNRRSDR